MTQPTQVPPGVDPDTPSAARMYDHCLGGTHNYPADREATGRFLARVPEMTDIAWSNRGFHQRAARWVAEQGIRQFIDIGAGLPTVGNTHEVVQKVAPGIRVLYADNDPIVLAYAAEMLAGSPTAALIRADARDPEDLLGNRELRELIDFTEPVGLLMTAVLHFVSDASDPWGLVRRYMDALAPGSYLVLSHWTDDKIPARSVQAMHEIFANSPEKPFFRPKADIERFFDGLEIVPPYEGAEPGITHVGNWGAADVELADSDGSRWLYCAVARRP